MKTQISKIVLLWLAFFCLAGYVAGQDGFKLRIGVNTALSVTEPGSDFIADPLATSGGVADFKSQIKPGIEAEFSVPVGEFIGLGAEFRKSRFSGVNDDPIYYNYFASPYSPILNYQHEALIYNTDIISILGCVRIYPLGHTTLTPYLKLSGGMAMIGTDLRFKSAENQVEIMDPLYSRGTRMSINEPDRFSTAQFGGTAGAEYSLSSNLALTAEFTFSYINSDIINGVPNFSYDESAGQSVYQDLSSLTSQLSIGASYSFGGSKKSKYHKAIKRRPNTVSRKFKRR
jgi:opacity protein-like surface antigen